MSYDEALRLCEEVLDKIGETRSRFEKRSMGGGSSKGNVPQGSKDGQGDAKSDIRGAIADLIRQIDTDMEGTKRLFEKYEDIGDVEDLELDDIVKRVDALLGKIDKALEREV